MNKVKCVHCSKAVKNKEDLIVTQKGIFRLVPYHLECANRIVKKSNKGMRMVNTTKDYMLLMMVAIGGVIGVVKSYDSVAVVCTTIFFLLTFQKILSYFSYERYFNK